MGRRYSRRRFTGNRDKYSTEQTLIHPAPLNTWTLFQPEDPEHQNTRNWSISIIPPTDIQGMRKAKHFTMSFSMEKDEEDNVFYYALVYVPAGYEPQPILLPTPGNAAVMYNSNQYIISSGVLDFSGGPCRIRSPLSRNLNSGDSISLVLAKKEGTTGTVPQALVSYAITLQ